MSNTITKNRVRAYLAATGYPSASSAEQMGIDALNFHGYYASNEATERYMLAVLDLVDAGVIRYDPSADWAAYAAVEGVTAADEAANLEAVRLSDEANRAELFGGRA